MTPKEARFKAVQLAEPSWEPWQHEFLLFLARRPDSSSWHTDIKAKIWWKELCRLHPGMKPDPLYQLGKDFFQLAEKYLPNASQIVKNGERYFRYSIGERPWYGPNTAIRNDKLATDTCHQIITGIRDEVMAKLRTLAKAQTIPHFYKAHSSLTALKSTLTITIYWSQETHFPDNPERNYVGIAETEALTVHTDGTYLYVAGDYLNNPLQLELADPGTDPTEDVYRAAIEVINQFKGITHTVRPHQSV